MGMFKTQKGTIQGVKKEASQVPTNGQTRDLTCPHEVPVNTCPKCFEHQQGDSKKTKPQFE